MFNTLKRRIRPLLIGLLISLFFFWWQFLSPSWMQQPLQRLESLIYDARLNLTLPPTRVDPRIVIIDIDEKSLREMGHWPWPRDQLGRLVEQLFHQGVIVLGFDMVFAEAERNSAHVVLSRLDEDTLTDNNVRSYLQAQQDKFDNNRIFSTTITDKDVVLGFVLDYQQRESTGTLPDETIFAEDKLALQALEALSAESFTANLSVLQQATPFAGFFSLRPDHDGIIRKAPLLARLDNQLRPSLSLEMLRAYLLLDEIGVQTAHIAGQPVIEGITLGDKTLPTDRQGNAYIPYLGKWGSFEYISATDVIHQRIDTAKLQGKIALLGTTAHGLFDLRATPVEAVYPGVEVHANLIAAGLDSSFPSRPEWAKGVDLVITLVLGLTLSLLFPFLGPLWLIAGTVLSLGLLVGSNFLIWKEMHFIIDMAPPLILVLSLSFFHLVYRMLHEWRSRRDLKSRFGQYIPPQLVQQMSENPHANYGLEGESRVMTVMFCDIRDFTSLSESLEAAKLKRLLNDYLSPMTQIIFDNHGTIDKYVGDMIMAFWGAPMSDPEHAEHGVRTAFSMLENTRTLSEKFTVKYGIPPLHIGIGLNTGTMNVGDMGSNYRRAYTVLGDAVNQGARFEALTKYYGVELLIGEETYRQLNGSIPCREIDRVRVKGKQEAQRIYEPLRCELALSQMTVYASAQELYRQQDWGRAEKLFNDLIASSDHPLYRLYLDRIKEYRHASPPADWNGIYQHQQKSGGS